MPYRVALVGSECENIGGNSVSFKTSVKYLGVHLDRTLSMRQHINKSSRSFDEPQQSDRISPKVPLQDLSRQLSFLVLIIVTQSSQVYQQTRSLGYSESRTTRHGLSWKKENEITLHFSSKNFTGYLWNSAASIRSRLCLIAILKDLYLRIFLHPSAPVNHLGLSDLPKKSYLKSTSETWNLSGNVLLVS